MIHDEFSCRTDISRARRYQLRHQRDGICMRCAEPAVTKFHCLKHAAAVRERMRKRLGCARRNFGAASYGSRLAGAVQPRMDTRLRTLRRGGRINTNEIAGRLTQTPPQRAGTDRARHQNL